MNLLQLAQTPAVKVTPQNSVMDAIHRSLPERVGAVAVVEGSRMVGIFTERDVMLKVVYKRLNPDRTPVGEVMTRNFFAVSPDMDPREVLKVMIARHIRHIPIIGDDGILLGMVSIRNVLQHLVDDLLHDVADLEAYIGAEPIEGIHHH